MHININIKPSMHTEQARSPGCCCTQVELTRPAPLDLRRLVGFMRLAHFGDASTAAAGVPLSYPIVEAFRLIIQAMVLPAFPVSVLGSVLARNTTTLTRALTPDDKLTYRRGRVELCMGESWALWDHSAFTLACTLVVLAQGEH